MSATVPLDCTGVVLAGGRSARMGRDKAELPIGGEPLLRRVVARLGMALGAVLVVGPESLGAVVPGVGVVPDRAPGTGPLGGLATALAAVETSRLFLVACDMPFIDPQLIRAIALLAAEPPSAEAVLLRTAHGLEYLHAVYATSCRQAVECALASEDHSLRGLIDTLRVREVTAAWAVQFDPEGLSTFNANTPAEWERALALAEAERA
jgi:molybdopterin-guanine dinucleotide biosynthesis protein A